MGQDIFRDISTKLLLKPFLRSGLSANQITGLNFLLLGISSLTLFALKFEYLGLAVATLMAMVDYIDGAVARHRGGNSKFGAYLDTSLDWLYLMLLVGILSYTHNVLPIGYITLIAITYGNWVQYNGNVTTPIPSLTAPALVLGILFKLTGLSIYFLMANQLARTIHMYWRSLWK